MSVGDKDKEPAIKTSALSCIIFHTYSTTMNETTWLPFTILTIILLCGQVTSFSCNSYCDEEGYFRHGFDCANNGIYCCGDAHERFCCNNDSLDASDYPPVYVCDKSSWWIFHWQIAIAMVAIVILILILAACCCQCCVNKTHRRNRQMASERRRHGRRNRRNDDLPRQPSFFSPEHPFAFTPPEYDSLPKDPPSYNELGGQDNPAFLLSPSDPSNNPMVRSASLPSYTSQADLNRGASDATLPPYSSRNPSAANTPEASRRSSIQSGIILNLTRRSSLMSRALPPQAEEADLKDKGEEAPTNNPLAEGQSAQESQESQPPEQNPPNGINTAASNDNNKPADVSTIQVVPEEEANPQSDNPSHIVQLAPQLMLNDPQIPSVETDTQLMLNDNQIPSVEPDTTSGDATQQM